MGVPKTWRNVEIEQQCAYGWTLETVQAVIADWVVVDRYAYILHDQCRKDDGTLKEPHIHVMLAFTSPVPTSAILARVKKITGRDGVVNVEQLEKIKSWKSAVAYLTHANTPEKHQYPSEAVISNYDIKPDVEQALANKRAKTLREDVINGIAEGRIKVYNIDEFVTPVEYCSFSRDIENAFKYRQTILKRKGDRDMKCIYIQGDSGTGKTTYAKMLCNQREFSYFVSSGSNDVLDGYGGQDAIILDDLRPSALRLADLLKMLDNNTASSVASRYSNKVLECRLVVITTTLPIDEFFSNVFSEQPETAKQLRRRCETYIKMYPEAMSVGVYVKATDEYVFMPDIPNPVASMYGQDPNSQLAIMVNSMRELLRGTIPDDMLDDAVQKMLEKADKNGFQSVPDDVKLPFD